MKIPKKINLFGYQWKIIIDKKKEGGDYKWANKTITLGNKFREEENVFFHEIIEAILTHNLHRYYNNESNAEYQFHFNHSDFCKIINEFYQVLKDNKII